MCFQKPAFRVFFERTTHVRGECSFADECWCQRWWFCLQVTPAPCRETSYTRGRCSSLITGSASTPKFSAEIRRFAVSPKLLFRLGVDLFTWAFSFIDLHPGDVGDVHQEDQNGIIGAKRSRDRNRRYSSEEAVCIFAKDEKIKVTFVSFFSTSLCPSSPETPRSNF